MKTTYELGPARLKIAIEAYMASINKPVTDADEFTVQPDGTVIVVVTEPDEVIVSPRATSAPNVSLKAPFSTTGFSLDGHNALIRGDFVLSADQLSALCVGAKFGPYLKYAQAILDNAKEHKINPLFVLANLVNQGVNTAYNNPWGISVDNYPHGPGGAQLGEANGHVPNGPRKFSDTEWRIAFDRQFAVVATSKAYESASTIAEWALIDAPPGAENDVHGTNAGEGKDVGAIYNRLVGALA